MTGERLEQLAEELGIDVIGASPASHYAETERHIRERRERGLFADMRFTMAQPEISCHPESLFEGARTLVSAALCYWTPGPTVGRREGRLPRYTWSDHYRALRIKLDILGRRIGGRYRVFVDANQHVDRAGAVRGGVGFFGKNTMLITRRFGSWVVLGALVTDVDIEPSPPLDLDCGSCTLCIDACPTGALDEPGVLDSTKCLSYWSQAAGSVPERYRQEFGDQVYGCDICQDVCPWNRGIEGRRARQHAPNGAEATVSLVDWLEAEESELRHRYERLFFPRKDPRYLRRNALIAVGNSGDLSLAEIAERYAGGDDELLAEHAQWAVERLQASTDGSEEVR